MNNVCLFFEDICKKLDKRRKDQDELLFNHEVDKAKAADENDENLDKIDDSLKELNHKLKFAMHHPQLEQLLKENFDKVDEYEAGIHFIQKFVISMT